MGDARQLKVIAVVNDFPSPSETFIHRKLAALADTGIDVGVVATRIHDRNGLPERLQAMPAVELDLRTIGRNAPASLSAAVMGRAAAGTLRSKLWAGAAVREITQLQPDIVHFEFSSLALTYEPILDLLHPARLVVSCRGAAEQIDPFVDETRQPALERLFRRLDAVHCVSEDMRATVIELGADPQRTFVNRPAVDPTELVPRVRRDAGEHPLRILSVGRLHWKKGLEVGIEAVRRLHAEGRSVEYTIVGEGTERQKLAFLIGSQGLGDVIRLVGAKSPPEVRQHLAATDVFLLPSLSEGLSNSVLEAMACALPVVTTSAGGMDEAVADGVHGIVVRHSDPEALATALRRVADLGPEREAMGERARKRVMEEFSLERQASVFKDCYRRLMVGELPAG